MPEKAIERLKRRLSLFLLRGINTRQVESAFAPRALYTYAQSTYRRFYWTRTLRAVIIARLRLYIFTFAAAAAATAPRISYSIFSTSENLRRTLLVDNI